MEKVHRPKLSGDARVVVVCAHLQASLPRRGEAANWVGSGRGRKSTRPDANGVVELSPCDFLDRLADLVPPPRKHRHRYHGVFAPNHKLRPAATALAIANVGKRRDAATGGHAGDGHATAGCGDANPNHKPRSHDTSRIAWAKLMARVGEEFPLACPGCGGDIRLIAFNREPGSVETQFTPCSPTALLTRSPPADREYTPGRSVARHRPEAHWRRASILSHPPRPYDLPLSSDAKLGKALPSRRIRRENSKGAGTSFQPWNCVHPNGRSPLPTCFPRRCTGFSAKSSAVEKTAIATFPCSCRRACCFPAQPLFHPMKRASQGMAHRELLTAPCP
jgi:hypothetical protein